MQQLENIFDIFASHPLRIEVVDAQVQMTTGRANERCGDREIDSVAGVQVTAGRGCEARADWSILMQQQAQVIYPQPNPESTRGFS